MNKIKFIIGEKELRVKTSGDTVAIVRRMPEIQSALFNIAASVGLGETESAAFAFAAGFFLFDWMVGTFDLLSTLFVLGVGMGLTAVSLFMLLDKLTVVRRK